MNRLNIILFSIHSIVFGKLSTNYLKAITHLEHQKREHDLLFVHWWVAPAAVGGFERFVEQAALLFQSCCPPVMSIGVDWVPQIDPKYKFCISQF